MVDLGAWEGSCFLMPGLEVASLHQKAVLWAAAAPSEREYDSYGERKVNNPVELKVRWEEGLTEAIDPNGQTVALDAVVVVDRDVEVGSIMWEGELGTQESTPVNLKEVVSFSKIPDIKGRKFRRVCGLRRFSDELPTLIT